MTVVTIVGVERMQGTSKKTGKDYTIGRIHCILPIMGVNADNAFSVGMQGAMYENIDPELIKKIERTSFPLDAELVVQDVMRFGEKTSIVTDIRPVQTRVDLQKNARPQAQQPQVSRA